MAIIGQVRRMIRLEALKKAQRKAFLERTRVQKIPVKWEDLLNSRKSHISSPKWLKPAGAYGN